MSKAIKIIVAIAIISGLAVGLYFLYPIIKERYFSSDEVVSEKTESVENQEGRSEILNQNGSEGTLSPEITPSDAFNEDEGVASEDQPAALPEIDSDDCDNECEGFSDDELTYCQQVCGLIPAETGIENCDNLSEIQKDYCLKDLAISKRDFKYCIGIKDAGVKNTCENRVAEDIIDASRTE
jgi:hypothetical protein